MAAITPRPHEPRIHIPARRISAFLYGNILVLSALIALSPAGLEGVRGLAYVLGVAFSTFVAHVASDVFAHLLHHPDGKGLSAELTGGLRDAVPIATSALLPTVVLLATWFGWLAAEPAWAIAIGTTLVRLSLLGPISAWMVREPFSLWPFLGGIALAALMAALAVLKAMLAH
jgi:hypothetical protein